MRMKKLLIVLLALMVVALSSCKKTRYCRCTTIQNEEVVNLGEDYYTIEDGSSCSDKSKEIVGWGQVTGSFRCRLRQVLRRQLSRRRLL